MATNLQRDGHESSHLGFSHVAERTNPSPPGGKETTWKMYRRKLKTLNRNKLILFVSSYYGIFFSHEVFMLAAVFVRDSEKEMGLTRSQTLIFRDLKHAPEKLPFATWKRNRPGRSAKDFHHNRR